MKIFFAKAAAREIKKLERSVQKNVIQAVEKLASDPRPHGVEKIKGYPAFLRIRAGNYRVVYHVFDAHTVVILVVRDRKDAYEGTVLASLEARLTHALESDPKVVSLGRRR